MNEWSQINGRIGQYTNEWMECKDEQMNEWMNEWMNEQATERTNEINKQPSINPFHCCQKTNYITLLWRLCLIFIEHAWRPYRVLWYNIHCLLIRFPPNDLWPLWPSFSPTPPGVINHLPIVKTDHVMSEWWRRGHNNEVLRIIRFFEITNELFNRKMDDSMKWGQDEVTKTL